MRLYLSSFRIGNQPDALLALLGGRTRTALILNADDIIADLLRQDTLVYAGFSAGPCVLGPTLRGIAGGEDDPTFVPPGYPSEVVWDGLGLLPFAIVPHYGWLPGGAGSTPMADYYLDNHIPFIALRDGEALVVDGDHSEVVGHPD